MQPAIIRGERRMLRVVNVPLTSGAVAGFAIDVQDLEDARSELARHIESQRELADRMTAGTAQFDADRTLGFFNRPFAMMTKLDPDWLAENPEFDRVLDRMRDEHRIPETRDYPAWKEERRSWFTSADEVIEEEWVLPAGDHLRVVAQVEEDKGLANIKVGQRVAFTVDVFGSKKFEGVVDEVSPTSRQGDVVFNISSQRQVNEFNVKIRFDVSKYPELKNGMSAKAWIYTD
jgi:PAS domain-containing protein